MKIKSLLLGCLASASFLSAGAHSASFSVTSPYPSSFNLAPASYTEDFESYDAGQWDESTVTNVGTFGALNPSGTGSGSTCTTLGGDCSQLFLSDIDVNGQGNITPIGGLNSLQANDTFGMVWNVSTRDGTAFNDIHFGIRDAADQGATFTVTLDQINGNDLGGDSVIETLTSQRNGVDVLFSLALADLAFVDDPVTSARISLVSSRLNDSFTFDGAALTAVPIPGALPLFLSALAGIGLISRKRRKA
ncbi:MAG: hypothetical protein V2I66_11515 [Halieaceae bacterium]|jgi:hypothetical protein|nr:hypothetical protein [Halieaceae bacterium]